MEADGETPWEACRREALEECGLQIGRGRLVCVDFRPRKADRPGGMRFVFHCGTFGDEQLRAISLQEEEISEHRFVDLGEAERLLSGPVRRRVLACAHAKRCIYLENGRPVEGVVA